MRDRKYREEILELRRRGERCPVCNGSLRCALVMYDHIDCLKRRDRKGKKR